MLHCVTGQVALDILKGPRCFHLHGASSLLGQYDPEDEGVTILAVVGNTHPTKWHHIQEELSSASGKTTWQTWPIANFTYPQSITTIQKYFRITYH